MFTSNSEVVTEANEGMTLTEKKTTSVSTGVKPKTEETRFNLSLLTEPSIDHTEGNIGLYVRRNH